MNEIIAKIDGGDLVFLALCALFTFGYVVRCVCLAFEPADERDDDEIADRIEQAIGDATRDLLDALARIETDTTAIRDSNAYLEQSEREGHADEALFEFYGRPHGFVNPPPPFDEFVDLTKHD